jgi:hypothetical protein
LILLGLILLGLILLGLILRLDFPQLDCATAA